MRSFEFNSFETFWSVDITKSEKYKLMWPHKVLIQFDWHVKDYKNSIKIHVFFSYLSKKYFFY